MELLFEIVIGGGILGLLSMDKMNTSFKVVFIVNFSDLNHSFVYCHRIGLRALQ